MDGDAEAAAYDSMDHAAVNRAFVDDMRAALGTPRRVLDLGAGTALIPIVLAARSPHAVITATDLAPAMLRLGARNVQRAGFVDRIALVIASATELPFAPGDFDAVVSNSLVHHLPDASVGFAAIARVAGDAGIFLRDLARPRTAADVDALVDRYAAGAPDDARALFHASLRAAFTVDEIRALADAAGLVDARVAMTSDRHWTLVRGPRRS